MLLVNPVGWQRKWTVAPLIGYERIETVESVSKWVMTGLLSLSSLGCSPYIGDRPSYQPTSNEIYEEIEDEVEYKTGDTYSGDACILPNQKGDPELVQDRLASIDHAYRGGKPYDESLTDADIEEMDDLSLRRISGFLKSFKQGALLQSLGTLVAVDLAGNIVRLDGVTEEGNEGKFTINAGKTELGGVFRCQDGDMDVVPYEPLFEIRDDLYSNIVAFEEDPGTPFHLHATGEESRLFPGPSGSYGSSGYDIGVVEQTRTDHVVVTYLGVTERNTIRVNIDLYNSQGVVDLGIYDTGVSPSYAEDVSIDPEDHFDLGTAVELIK